MTRLTDYGIMLLAHVAGESPDHPQTARDLATKAHLPLPTVSKILKLLARSGILAAQRGKSGGFNLARRPEDITMAHVIGAMEGPLALTDCCNDHPVGMGDGNEAGAGAGAGGSAGGAGGGGCPLERHCPVGVNWKRLNAAVFGVLAQITLAEMLIPRSPRLVNIAQRRPTWLVSQGT